MTIAELLGRIELGRTLFLVVSKSGGTAETMAQYLVVRGRLLKRSATTPRHLVFVTDPDKGCLRRIAREESIPALDNPVERRWSLQRAVGRGTASGRARRDRHRRARRVRARWPSDAPPRAAA